MEEDGYEVGAFRGPAVGVEVDEPAATPRIERARNDGFAGGELILDARVAVDVEQVVPRDGFPDDGRGGAGLTIANRGGSRRWHWRRGCGTAAGEGFAAWAGFVLGFAEHTFMKSEVRCFDDDYDFGAT